MRLIFMQGLGSIKFNMNVRFFEDQLIVPLNLTHSFYELILTYLGRLVWIFEVFVE